MKFEQIKSEIKGCGNKEIRVERAEYLELVVTKTHEPALNEKLAEIFGAPAWPSNDKLSDDVTALIQNFGGIMEGQSLYVMQGEGNIVFLMLWPWSDKNHTTVKLGLTS